MSSEYRLFPSFQSSLSHLIAAKANPSGPGPRRAPCHPLHPSSLRAVFIPLLPQQSSCTPGPAPTQNRFGAQVQPNSDAWGLGETAATTVCQGPCLLWACIPQPPVPHYSSRGPGPSCPASPQPPQTGFLNTMLTFDRPQRTTPSTFRREHGQSLWCSTYLSLEMGASTLF